MSLALNKTGRSIVYSCEWPFYLRPVQQVRSCLSRFILGLKWAEEKNTKMAKQHPEKLAALCSDKGCKMEEKTFSSRALKHT